MNLLQKMNSAEFKQLLDFKATYPTLGEDLIKALGEKSFPIQLTLAECVMLGNALDAPWSGAFHEIFQTFKSKP
ncbi:MAG: hypothetical protein EB117_13330 [Betaproteobacteria bacterium]|nr:hypothetical protein [Betaproteobacteria bacterium]